MGTKLTKKQLAVLNFLEDYIDENGCSPTYREIRDELGLSSVSAVAEHIDNLVAKGAVKKSGGAARSLEVLDYHHDDAINLFKLKMAHASPEDRAILEKAAALLGLSLD